MANDKDFIVKNAVEVSGSIKGAIGTSTSGTEYYAIDKAVEITNIASNDATPVSVSFNPTGTKMYVAGGGTDDIGQFTLSTAFDLSTATYVNAYDVGADATVNTNPRGPRFNSDGTKMYVVNVASDDLHQYSLSTAYDVSTATYDTVSFDLETNADVPLGFVFNNDGTKLYVASNIEDAIVEYTLTTGFDLSTASHSYDFDVSNEDATPNDVVFNSDGTVMFVLGGNTEDVFKYSLTTAYDLSTASYTGTRSLLNLVNAQGLAFNNDGSRMFIADNETNNIFSFNTEVAFETVDLSTGNYFSHTLTADTAYIISNAGDVQSFQLEVTGAAAAYDLSSTSYDNKSYSVNAQETIPNAIAFKPDGTKMYISGSAGDTIDQYSLSTAWDVSTASFDSVSLGVNSQDNNPWGLFFKSDGTRMFMLGYGSDGVYQYSLSTAWDLSTASYDSVSLSVNSQSTTPKGLAFKSDGTSLFIGDSVGNNVYQYTLTTAWDLSTASYASISYAVSGLSTLQHITFNNDGTYLYVLDGGSDEVVKEYSLSTAWDVSTASATGNTLTVTEQDPTMHGLVFKPDGTRLYITGNTGDNIYQYSGADLTLTWPSSIEWAGGVAPAAPANSETDVFTISTYDGGTSYVGVKTSDNLS